MPTTFGSTGTGTYDIDIADCLIYEDKIVAEEVKEETTASGIVIADVGDAQKVRFAKVVAVGPGRWEAGVFVPTVTKIGDLVMFGKHATGEPFKNRGRDCLLFREGDLVARQPA